MSNNACFNENNTINVKILAYYLPQFHRVPENDEWWGEGFTEWTAVRNAKPLWEGHKQPVEPLNDFYYDLSEKKAMEWQSKLMQEYSIDGLCIYHYWFKDGRKILEKPVENLLKWTDIDIPFCLCWANESWIRTWANLDGGNNWADKYDIGYKKDDGVLLKQSYGLEEEWKEHFEYMLPFFQDSRYLRIDNKPIIVIYKPSDIPCLCAMRYYWDQLAKENGLNGLCVICAISDLDEATDDEIYVQKCPGGINRCESSDTSGVELYSYDRTWELLFDKRGHGNCYYAGFVSYDDTPRRGEKGAVYLGFTPSKFEKYLTRLLEKSASEGKEFVFLNAWNEWGEGMYLEPDKANGYAVLEAVRNSKQKYNKEMHLTQKTITTERAGAQPLLKRTQHNLVMMDKWMDLKEKEVYLSGFLIERGIKTVVIYGCNIFTRHLVDDLTRNGIQILSIVDKNAPNINNNFTIELPSEKIKSADCIIVTPINFFQEIFSELREQGIGNRIINLEQMIMEAE